MRRLHLPWSFGADPEFILSRGFSWSAELGDPIVHESAFGIPHYGWAFNGGFLHRDGRPWEYATPICRSVSELRGSLLGVARMFNEKGILIRGGGRLGGHVHLGLESGVNATDVDMAFAISFAPFIVMLNGWRRSHYLAAGLMYCKKANTTIHNARHIEFRVPPSPFVESQLYLDAWIEAINLGCWLYENSKKLREREILINSGFSVRIVYSPDVEALSNWGKIFYESEDLYRSYKSLGIVAEMARNGERWNQVWFRP